MEYTNEELIKITEEYNVIKSVGFSGTLNNYIDYMKSPERKAYIVNRIEQSKPIRKQKATMISSEEIKRLYDMKLHEQFQHDGFCIQRVPGGWIYTKTDRDHRSSTFVPFSDEFMEPKSQQRLDNDKSRVIPDVPKNERSTTDIV